MEKGGASGETKASLRARALALRATLNPNISAALACHLDLTDAASIAAYWPMPGEPDIVPLLYRLHLMGHRVLLPKTPPRGCPLTFHIWHPGIEMAAGRFNTIHPVGPEAVPDLILVPYLAFDRQGGRLGYGGGYYDRTLAVFHESARAGLGFAGLEVPEIPIEAHDVVLPRIVTELGVIPAIRQ